MDDGPAGWPGFCKGSGKVESSSSKTKAGWAECSGWGRGEAGCQLGHQGGPQQLWSPINPDSNLASTIPYGENLHSHSCSLSLSFLICNMGQ